MRLPPQLYDFPTLIFILLNLNGSICAFNQPVKNMQVQIRRSVVATSSIAAEEFSPATCEKMTSKLPIILDETSIGAMSTKALANSLIDFIPRMTGKDEEYRLLELCINSLEDKYTPVQTINFLNLATSGEWQLLFSTNLLSTPHQQLQLKERIIQRIEADEFNGNLTNLVMWEFNEEGFDSTGEFFVKCMYHINQGARMIIDLKDHELRPARGSNIPKDVPKLVGSLYSSIPRELFDPNGHAMDITYIDDKLKIVRFTGPTHEGVRNIFMRCGNLLIDPVQSCHSDK